MSFYDKSTGFFPRKGYRTDATVSVFLGFLLFLIPAKKPCFGKREKGKEDPGEKKKKRCGTFPITFNDIFLFSVKCSMKRFLLWKVRIQFLL